MMNIAEIKLLKEKNTNNMNKFKEEYDNEIVKRDCGG